MTTVRAINQYLFSGKTVCASYMQEGERQYGRILRARRHQGTLQGKLLGSGRWVAIMEPYAVK